MKKYLSGSVKVLIDYTITLVIFVVMIYPFFKYLIPYSLVIFIIMCLLIYADMFSLALREKRPQYNLNPYPLKGFVLGFIGFLPFIVLQVVGPFIVFGSDLANRIKYLALKTLLGPVYAFLKLGNETVLTYVIILLIVPVLSMLGYMAGFYGFELGTYVRKRLNIEPKKVQKRKNNRPKDSFRR